MVYEVKDSRLITHVATDGLHVLADLLVLTFSKQNTDRARNGRKKEKKGGKKPPKHQNKKSNPKLQIIIVSLNQDLGNNR